MNLETYFDRIVIINLKRRPDRLERFQKQQAAHWPLGPVTVVPAVDGNRVGVPHNFTEGGGAYGCRQSHCGILEQALTDDVQRLLVLEDDAEWRADLGERLSAFLSAVPDDWQQLMIGGQHHRTPLPVNGQVLRVQGSQRTHCYAVRPAGMRSLLSLWRTATVHIDWLMSEWHKTNIAYSPHEFLVGQDEGKSDINGRLNRKQWWNKPRPDTPVVFLSAPLEVAKGLRSYGWHQGYNRKGNYDSGIDEAAKEKNPLRLLQTIDTFLWEIASDPSLVLACVHHPALTYEFVRSARPNIIHVVGKTVEECLEQVPVASSSRKDTDSVIVLRTSRGVVDMLKLQGWHIGYWTDPITGQDNGLRKIATLPDPVPELKTWLEVIGKEAEQIARGRVVVWHDAITLEQVKSATDRNVVEVKAATVEEAMGGI